MKIQRMIRQICNSVLLVGLLTTDARGEAVREDQQVGPGNREVVRMTVTPADEPSPIFRYRLSLRPHELLPGNSVAYYMRAFPERGLEHKWQMVRDKHGEAVDNWYAGQIPLSQLPADEFRDAAGKFQELVDSCFKPGSLRRDTDWGVGYEDIKGPNVISFLLPELQGMREAERALSLQTRLAMLEGRYDDAIELLRVGYRLGRDVAQQPILVSGLVGIAIERMVNEDAIDLIASPDSPNLYWALTEAPHSQVSMREAMRLELAIGPRMFEFLEDPARKDLSDEEWDALWKRSANTSVVNQESELSELFQPFAFGLMGFGHARERLIALGRSPEEVDAMPVGKVLTVYSARAYQMQADRLEQAIYFDFSTSKRLTQQANAANREMGLFGTDPDHEIVPVAALLLPVVSGVRTAYARAERNYDALRVIEALRMHAAQSNGEWPTSLDEITCVPIPHNVATGEPFEYHRDGKVAVLVLPFSDGFQYERRYELTLAE